MVAVPVSRLPRCFAECAVLFHPTQSSSRGILPVRDAGADAEGMVQRVARAARPYQPAEIEADFAVHRFGMLVGAVAAAVLLALTAAANNPRTLWSVVAYSIGLVAMLSFSAAYHFHHASERGELLRRLDHAAIFVMIAGTYTPFTACILNGAAAV